MFGEGLHEAQIMSKADITRDFFYKEEGWVEWTIDQPKQISLQVE